MVLNPGKFSYVMTGNKALDKKVILNGVEPKTSNQEKLLGVLMQFVIFKPLSYCFKETKGFDVKAPFASRP